MGNGLLTVNLLFIAADFTIRMIIVKVRHYRQGYPLTKINALAYMPFRDENLDEVITDG